jgi:hypothetical protein
MGHIGAGRIDPIIQVVPSELFKKKATTEFHIMTDYSSP